jgi:hypothetical protein
MARFPTTRRVWSPALNPPIKRGRRLGLLRGEPILPYLKVCAGERADSGNEPALLAPRHVLPGRRDRIREMASDVESAVAGGVAFIASHVAVGLWNVQGDLLLVWIW